MIDCSKSNVTSSTLLVSLNYDVSLKSDSRRYQRSSENDVA
jgi:hypothetical protein